MQVESIGRSKYFITFTDTYSGHCEVFCIKTKDEAATVTKQYIEKLKNQLGKKPKVLRSDRGTEYVNKELQDYLNNEGIKFEYTVGYAPQQNGCAERMNRTLVEAVRTMLSDAGLPNCYWAEAVKYACYVNNRLINQKHKTSPLETLYGEKPSYENIHQFGCEVYVMVPYEKRRKLDQKAVKGVFVGNDESSKGFRIADTKTRKISVSREVVFLKKPPTNDRSVQLCESERFSNPVIPIQLVEEQVEEESVSEDEEFVDAEDNVSSENQVHQDDVQLLRRSTRANLGQPPQRYGDYVVYSASESDNFEPKTYQEAISCTDKEKWLQAMQEELTSIDQNKTWELVDLPAGRQAIGSKWVFKIKKGSDGTPIRYKARLVAQGFSQKYGIDYDEVFAPVVRSSTFKIFMSVAGTRNLRVKHYDVKTAFLNGDLKEEIYMK